MISSILANSSSFVSLITSPSCSPHPRGRAPLAWPVAVHGGVVPTKAKLTRSWALQMRENRSAHEGTVRVFVGTTQLAWERAGPATSPGVLAAPRQFPRESGGSHDQ